MQNFEPTYSLSPLMFLGINYHWGGRNPLQGLDCFSFFNWVLYSHCGHIIPGFDWIYDTYINEVDSPVDLVTDEVTKLYGEPDGVGNNLELVVINWGSRRGLGILTYYNNDKYILHHGTSGSGYHKLSRMNYRIKGMWNPFTKTIKVDQFYDFQQ